MRFTQTLTSHLTPEWRKHYINYESLKKRIYEMIGQTAPSGEEDENHLLVVTVDRTLQDEFFQKVHYELEKVVSFYRAREADLSNQLRDLEEQIDLLEALRGNRRTRNLQTTKRKHRNLKELLSEFYLNLALLQNYQQLNHTGFRKSLKKYDKLAKSDRGKRFFKQDVCKAEFWTSQKVTEMIDRTETLMIEKLEDGNRSRAMNRLRVPPLDEKDRSSPFSSWKTGLFMGVILTAIFVVGIAFIYRPLDSWDHVKPTVRGLRVGLVLCLWFYGFAVNMHGWRRAGVNSVLIFGVDPREHLNFIDVFEVASLIGVLFAIGTSLSIFSHFWDYPEWVGPLVMLALIFILFVLPLPLLKHKSRIWLGKEMGRIFLAPFFPVTFPDFWIADQMNSLAVVFLDIEFFICYMVYGLHFPNLSIQCGSVTYGLRPFVAALPAWFRFAQCLRRYYDTRSAFPHLVNAGKYSTSFFVVFFSSLATGLKASNFEDHPTGYYVAFTLWVVSAIVSTCYTFTWDIKMDWGLFEGKYKLRSELIYQRKIYYILAVIEDLIFRTLWTLNISVGEAGSQFLQGDILGTILAMMEVFRRFVWNFFRLENEHLNNAGEFRAVRDIAVVPLDLSHLPKEEDEGEGGGAEKPLREHFKRRISKALIELHESDGIRNRHSNQIAPSNSPKKSTTTSTAATTVIANRRLNSDSTVTEITLVGDGTLPPERRKRCHSPVTSPIEEEREDDMDIDSLLEEIKLDDDSEGSREKESSGTSSTVTITATVHGQRDTS